MVNKLRYFYHAESCCYFFDYEDNINFDDPDMELCVELTKKEYGEGIKEFDKITWGTDGGKSE